MGHLGGGVSPTFHSDSSSAEFFAPAGTAVLSSSRTFATNSPARNSSALLSNHSLNVEPISNSTSCRSSASMPDHSTRSLSAPTTRDFRFPRAINRNTSTRSMSSSAATSRTSNNIFDRTTGVASRLLWFKVDIRLSSVRVMISD